MTTRTGIFGRKVLIFSVICGVLACAESPDEAHEFALIGDNPYRPELVSQFENLIDDVNARAEVEWVIHVGDIRGGGPQAEPCTDEVLRSKFELYQGFNVPLIYTPGDNDWFDCGGETAGGYDPYERLGYVRSLFFSDPSQSTGGRAMEVTSQGTEEEYEEFVENVLWMRGGVVYATIHLVGITRAPSDSLTAARRMDAAVSWIDRAFQMAQDSGSAAVFLATQVDPWVVSGLPRRVRRMCDTCLDPRPGMEPLYSSLLRHTAEFTGPVILAVGDTHIFRVDKPLYRDDGTLVENFTRVETFGHPNVHWIRVTADPRNRGVFTFRQEVVPENVVVRNRR